jgi:hypothetical protein
LKGSRLPPRDAGLLTSREVSGSTSKTLSDTSDHLRRNEAGRKNPAVGRKGAFKDRPLWRRLQAIHHEIKEGLLKIFL